MSFQPNRARYGRHSTSRAQGGTRAQYSGIIPIVRHSVDTRYYVSGSNSGTSPTTIGSGKALAFPLVVYQGSTGGAAGESSAPITRKGSRVNHVGCNLQIVQSDTSKPNHTTIPSFFWHHKDECLAILMDLIKINMSKS